MTKTEKTIRATIENGVEDIAAAEAVAAWADAHAGKLLTVRNAPEGWTIRKEYGMCQLETAAYADARWDRKPPTPGPRISLLLAHQETGVEIPTAAVLREKNTAYFSAAVDRNESRRAVLESGAEIKRLARAVPRFMAALEELRDALGEGTYPDLFADRYEIRKAVGIDTVKIHPPGYPQSGVSL
jgi:hypothetical protein